MKPARFFKTVNDMFISFFPFFFLFFIYLLMIVGINITFYLDSYLFKSLALFFCHRADRICLQMQEFQVKPEEKWKYMLQCRNHSEKCLMTFTFLLVWYSCKFFGTFFRYEKRWWCEISNSWHLHFRISCVSGAIIISVYFAIERTD